jgi:hypothetical protein
VSASELLDALPDKWAERYPGQVRDILDEVRPEIVAVVKAAENPALYHVLGLAPGTAARVAVQEIRDSLVTLTAKMKEAIE